MTIITRQGNLLDAKGVIVHGCNCQGVMGSGIAAQIRKKWPTVYERYKLEQSKGGLELGDTHWIRVEDDVFVINALAQRYYGRDGKLYVNYRALGQCFKDINEMACAFGWEAVNFPLIGCGLAGGDWNVVSAIIDQELDDSLQKVLWTQ